MSDHHKVLRLDGIRKSYNVGEPNETEVLHGISFELERNDFAALVGPSGSGKSTLLNILGLLDEPTSGELYLLDQATRTQDDPTRTRLRNRHIGFVFQFHHLIPAFTALENVLMPLMVDHGKPTLQETEDARKLLAEIGLAAFADQKPGQLSGGQQQRVAIARALITRPALLLADEPTGNLDTQTADSVFDLFRRFNREFECAVLIVTHDPRLSARCDRVLTLVDGKLKSDSYGQTPLTANPPHDNPKTDLHTASNPTDTAS
jgi:lipoprotein-releasing system ATP-binding protein